ncbi:methionyl-tRNA formyltransferase, partial [Candidatus Gottesmanbacteria bacterium]|nr:methionyl-tRNA formyltransferase [Candidatus Gottesmanbacteria bacterium]
MIDPTARIIFFGSTGDSVSVLEKLITPRVRAVVTQPARPVGRKQMLTPTPVETWAKARGIAVLSFPSDPEKPWLYADERQVIDALQPLKANLLVSACYGQKIPWETIRQARFGGLNVHPSLLPRWRGADPVPWAILAGDHQTGVTVATLSEKFDEGAVVAQKKFPIIDSDTSDALRTTLFTIGADLLMEVIPEFLSTKHGMKSSLITDHLSLIT